DSYLRQPFRDFAGLKDMNVVGHLLQCWAVRRIRDDDGEHRHAETFEMPDKIAPFLIPSQQDADASAQAVVPGSDVVSKILKRPMRQWLDTRQPLQHFFRTAETSTCSEPVCFVADEEQIEKRLLRQHRASERCGDGNGLFKDNRIFSCRKSVQDKAVTNEV